MRVGTSGMGGLPLVIVISGTFEAMQQQLLTIYAIALHRKHNGWLPYQSDEEWLYVTHPERSVEGVCPVCQGFEATETFMGNEIPTNFPTAEQIDPIHYIHPRVHEAHRELRGQCRCELLWFNPREVLVERLTREIEEAVL